MKPVCLIIILLALATIASADSGTPSTPNNNASPPAFGADVTIPSNVAWRGVFGSVTVGATALAPGTVNIQFCGAGTQLQGFNLPTAQGQQTWGYYVVLRGGDCYEFANAADPAGVNAITRYSTFDVLNESFEGRTHANNTWEGQVHANATFEGQVHANATFEGQVHANATFEGQVHANATWCPLTGTGCFVPFPDANGNFTGNFSGDFTGTFDHFNATGNFSGFFNNTNSSGNHTGNFSEGSFNGNLSGNFTQTFTNTTQGGGSVPSTLDVTFQWAFASLVLWIVVGYFAIERGVWLIVPAPAAEILNIALDGAGATRMWGEQFSVLILLGGGVMHLLLFVIPRIIKDKATK